MSYLYDTGRNLFAEAGANWQPGGSNMRAILVKAAYAAANSAAHVYLSEVNAANIVGMGGANDQANSANVAPATPSAGVCDGADVTFTAVPANAGSLGAIIVYKGTGNDANSPLVAFIDAGTGLPVTPNGGDIAVAWDNGANKIFKL